MTTSTARSQDFPWLKGLMSREGIKKDNGYYKVLSRTYLELSRTVKNCQRLSRIVKNCQELSRIVKNSQELSKIVKNCLVLSSLLRIVTSYRKLLRIVQKLSRIVKWKQDESRHNLNFDRTTWWWWWWKKQLLRLQLSWQSKILQSLPSISGSNSNSLFTKFSNPADEYIWASVQCKLLETLQPKYFWVHVHVQLIVGKVIVLLTLIKQ